MDFVYIDTPEKLNEAAEIWKKANVIGVDLECENGLHRYGTYISLIQLSTLHGDWIVDVLALKNIDPVLKMFEDSSIQKIFHDVSFDFRILHYEFKCRPHNIFDTQVASQLLGEGGVGLGSLLEKYFHVAKEKKFQKADWSKRPLTKDMLAYAIQDTAYLIKLRNVLKQQLLKKKRMMWVKEEYERIEKSKVTFEPMKFLDVKGAKQLTDEQRGSLKQLFILREKLAKTVNRPVHFIIHNKKLVELCASSPSPSQWGKLAGVHPVVKKKAKEFIEAFIEGRKEKIAFPVVQKKRLSAVQKKRLDFLNTLREKMGKDLGLEKQVVITQDQMLDLVLGKKISLKRWQIELLKKYGGMV